MAFNYGASDIVALLTLVAKLYNDVYVPAREAPKTRRELIKELAALKDVLSTLADDTKSTTFQRRLGESRKHTLNRCLLNCGETLAKLSKLVEKHRNPRGSLWGGIKWVGIKGEVAELKSKIAVYSAHLSLCLSSIGNSTLLRLECSLETALTRIPEVPSDAEDEADVLNPLTHTISEPKDDRKSEVGPGLNGRRRTTPSHIANPGMNGFSESTPLLSENDRPEFGVFHAQMRNDEQMGEQMKVKRSVVPANRVTPKHVPGSAGDRVNHNEESAAELVAGVLRILKEKETFHRPLRHDRARIKNHQPNKVLAEKFGKHVNDELDRHRLSTFSTKKWLRISTWWLLKAKHTRQECERSEPADTSLSLSVYAKSSVNQAYVDSLKASWILDTFILGKEDLYSLQIHENRKLAQDLVDAVSDESSLYKPIDTPEKFELMEQNHYIIDEVQFRSDDVLTAWTDDGRWITVEQDDAGEEDEKVLFRTFVNATIGSKSVRIRSKGAPYMLLLYTKKGESEIQVTISNQSGSCGLNRSFTNEDLQKCDGTTSSALHQGALLIELNFNEVKVEISFTSESDLEEFIRIPRTYFQAVRRREPQQLAEATETVIFQSSVKSFQQLRASTLTPLASEQGFESCDLRVLETTTKQAWETVRRIVISSSAGEKKHWCKEFFLPLSGVQMRREGDNQYATMVKWSDCTYETNNKTDGNYNKVYSYIYKENSPNIALSLCFRNVGDADSFETAILRLPSTPIFSWPSTISPTHFVHTVSDTGENAKAYRAILLIRTRYGWRYSALLYVYRDTDFQYARATKQYRLQFHLAYFTHYISNHFGHTFLPKEPPHFEKCEKLLCSEKSDSLDDSPIEFDDEVDCMRFLSSLSGGHQMIFSRRANFIKRPPRFKFGSINSNKGPADVQLWQKGNSVRLLTRWVHGVEDKWMSMTVPPQGMDRQGGSYRASLPKVDYQRGRKVNMSNMEATDPSNRADGKKSGPIMIGFETAVDEEDFLAAFKSALKPIVNPFAGELDSRRSETSFDLETLI